MYTKEIINDCNISTTSTKDIPFTNDCNISNSEFWRQLSSSSNNKEHYITLSYNLQEDEEEDNNNNNNKSKIEVTLNIKSCPATILSISTFELFESNVFVGVPLVISIETIYT